MSTSMCTGRPAPRLTIAAVGVLAFTMGIPVAAGAGPDFPIVEKSNRLETQGPSGRGSIRKQRRKKARLSEVSAARCSAPNAACDVPVPGTLQAYAITGPASPTVGTGRRGGMTTSRNCLTPAAKALLARLEAQFGAVKIVSTCRRGATIAGTRQPSMHRYGKAFDFIAPAGRKAEVVRWLRDNSPGVTMTYYRMSHIHTDVGPYHKVIYGAGAPRRAQKSPPRHQARADASHEVQ